MNSYDEYCEKLLKLKEEEIRLYKNFIEQELKCRIRETVETEQRFDETGVRMVRFKVIEIPQSQYVIKLNC